MVRVVEEVPRRLGGGRRDAGPTLHVAQWFGEARDMQRLRLARISSMASQGPSPAPAKHMRTVTANTSRKTENGAVHAI